ncbi:MAG TPA: hypothetical protein VFH22_12940, partial [Rhodocyclaceae bacterium]|nr:hypothetical protein [Rhodocyclaceae bacterium]
MFKWLDKVISGANGKAEPAAAPAPAASPPAPARPREKPLDAPLITSDNLPGADDYANGILIRKGLVDRAYHPVA